MSQNDLFLSLLRPAVLHILRATGFQHGKPSAVDTIVDLTARYLSLLAERTAYNAFSNHNDLTPDITDVRMAMQDCALLVPTMTAGEELWKEILRKPLDEYNPETGARENEEARRDAEDTADVTEFIEWVMGDQNQEIRRIAGTYKPIPQNPTEQLDQEEMEDYLNSEPHSTCHGHAPANHICSSHEETQQNGCGIAVSRNRSRRIGRAKARQDRRRRRRFHTRVVSQDSRTGSRSSRVKTREP
jgi:hypothetical protein